MVDYPVSPRIELSEDHHGVGKPTTKLIDETVDYWAFIVDSLDTD